MGFLSKFFRRNNGIDLETLLDFVPPYFENRFGELGMVWHEIVSDDLHIDVHSVPARIDFPYHVLFTTGMSMKRMRDEPFFSEMFIILPEEWQINELNKNEENYWPVRILKTFARLPNTNNLTLRPFMTIPYMDGGCAPGTLFESFMVIDGRELGDGFGPIQVDGQRQILPYLVAPLTVAESAFKVSQPTADGLWIELKNRGIDRSPLLRVDLSRPSLID